MLEFKKCNNWKKGKKIIGWLNNRCKMKWERISELEDRSTELRKPKDRENKDKYTISEKCRIPLNAMTYA